MSQVLSAQRSVLHDRNMPDPDLTLNRSKRPSDDNDNEVPPKRSKLKDLSIHEPMDEDDVESSEEEEDPRSDYVRRMMMRNKMYKNVDLIETAQVRMEHGDSDDVGITKAVKHYVNSEILKKENRPLVNGRDLSIDSLLGDRLSKVLLIKAGKLSSGRNKFNFTDFAKRVKERGSLGEMYKKDLGGILDVTSPFSTLALVDFGALPKPKKAPVPRGPRNRDKGELVNVQGKQTNEIEDEKDSDFSKRLDYIRKMFKKAIKDRGTNHINYYEFVIDPEDFGATVQNCFSVAFLLKDMNFFLEKKDDEDYPYIRTLTDTEKRTKKEAAENDRPVAANQCVNTLTYAKWEGLIKKLKIKRAMIKQE